jgi:hypothetical protein
MLTLAPARGYPACLAATVQKCARTMPDDKNEFITTLLFPNEYARNLNQVAGLTTRRITYLKRKFVSKAGYELVEYPIEDCSSITYRDERPLVSIVLGVFLMALLSFIAYMMFKYWDDLPANATVPVGALFLVGLYGFRFVFAARRHRLVFAMRDGTKLTWKSRSGDYKYKEGGAAKVVEFAREQGTLASPAAAVGRQGA